MTDLEREAALAGVSVQSGFDGAAWFATVELGGGDAYEYGPYPTQDDAYRGGIAKVAELGLT